jgi:polyferredoxin
MVKNEKNELILQRTVTRWRMCIDYRKLNKATKKDHFPLPFIDEMLERLAKHAYFCFLDGYSGFMQISFTRMINTKQRLHALMERLHIEGCPSVYVTLRPLFNVA